ncbi:uncharacterized protein LOC130445668 isoform X1 [Diorhabda sublineata]|uniref:uncharacterized protein LOC130445668 isoform X1 n=1 Tax=Diorhabda sublineata TaxID=1163346 RepID=UPI0024E0EBA9|nr:uncharacterized protein LOC130445668 isoform X1 [Diorhabda sublineata]
MEMETSLKNESNDTILVTEEDGIQYSDFENVEYEEVGDVYTKENYEHSSFTLMKNYHRKRTRNFSQNECNLICAILEEYYEIIENKRNDHKTNFLKNKAWTEITQKFNDNTKDEYRTALQLRTFYENLKKKRKKMYKEAESGENIDVSGNQTEKIIQSDILTNQAKILLRDNPHVFQESYKKTSFIEEYHKKRIQLVETEIQKVKDASEQQRRLFLLQEEKLMLEIQEIKQRLQK